MRVLHISPGKLFGGVETLQVTLARCREFVPEMEPEFAMPFSRRLADELRGTAASVHILGDVRISNPVSVLRAAQKLPALVKMRRYDVAVCHMPWSLAVFGWPLRRTKVPIVFWMHGATDGRHWLERLARLTRPDLAICPSEFTKASLPNLFANLEAVVINYPVLAPTRAFDSGDRLAVRHELATSPEDVVIIQVSRMDPIKGHLLHLKALSLLRHVAGWTCWMVGGAQSPAEIGYYDSLKRRGTQLGITERLRFTGERSDVDRLLAAADIYCQPNVANEGLPIAFAQAFYAALPIVTTHLGGFWEVVDGSCGRLVEPNNPRALAQALQNLFSDGNLRSELGTSGAARARKMFDPRFQMGKLYDTLKRLKLHTVAYPK